VLVVLVAVAPAVWRNWAAIRLALSRIYSDFRDYPEMVAFTRVMRGDGQFDAWVQRARAVAMQREIERRSLKLRRVGVEYIGPCPQCGGDDRFAINTQRQVFNCRGCGICSDTINLVEHIWFVEPWPEPADGDALIRDIMKTVQKHVVIARLRSRDRFMDNARVDSR